MLAPDVVVWSLPMRTRFRGLTSRDGVLVRGDAGWAEFSPFWDYDDEESAGWWRAAHEAAELGWPAPVRDRVPVNVTVPAVDAATAHRIVTGSGGCRTAKVKVAERGQDVADEIARLEAVRDAIGPGGAIRVGLELAALLQIRDDRLKLLQGNFQDLGTGLRAEAAGDQRKHFHDEQGEGREVHCSLL